MHGHSQAEIHDAELNLRNAFFGQEMNVPIRRIGQMDRFLAFPEQPLNVENAETARVDICRVATNALHLLD
jgi:hypothetical protein